MGIDPSQTQKIYAYISFLSLIPNLPGTLTQNPKTNSNQNPVLDLIQGVNLKRYYTW